MTTPQRQQFDPYLRFQVMLHELATDYGYYFGFSKRHLHELQQAQGGERFGLEGTAKMLYGTVSVLEWRMRQNSLPTLVDLNLLSNVSTFSRYVFTLDASPRYLTPDGYCYSPPFAELCNGLQETELTPLSSLVLNFGTTVPFSEELIERVVTLREALHPLTVRIEALHRSWQKEVALRMLRATKMNVVHTYGPDLPGFSFELPSFDHSSVLIRYAGENKEQWLAPELTERQTWVYDKTTIGAFATDLSRMLDGSTFGETIALMDIYPVNNAGVCLRALVERFFNA